MGLGVEFCYRAVAARKDYMRKAVLLAVALSSQVAHAQVNSGTSVLLNFTKDKLIVAADSRGRYGNGDRPPNDFYCKISTFSHKIVFANIGTAAYGKNPFYPVDGWNNTTVAHDAVQTAKVGHGDGQTHIHDIAFRWGTILVRNWSSLHTWRPNVVRKLAEEANGVLTAAVFVEAVNGAIYTQVVGIRLTNSILSPIEAAMGDLDSCWPCGRQDSKQVCAVGIVTVPANYCTKSTPRFLPQIKGGHLGLDDAEDFTIWLGKMTAACDLTGGIGGEIDALDLGNNGSIRWIHRKDNCPENQD
jgi:hypothetical protein